MKIRPSFYSFDRISSGSHWNDVEPTDFASIAETCCWQIDSNSVHYCWMDHWTEWFPPHFKDQILRNVIFMLQKQVTMIWERQCGTRDNLIPNHLKIRNIKDSQLENLSSLEKDTLLYFCLITSMGFAESLKAALCKFNHSLLPWL